MSSNSKIRALAAVTAKRQRVVERLRKELESARDQVRACAVALDKARANECEKQGVLSEIQRQVLDATLVGQATSISKVLSLYDDERAQTPIVKHASEASRKCERQLEDTRHAMQTTRQDLSRATNSKDCCERELEMMELLERIRVENTEAENVLDDFVQLKFSSTSRNQGHGKSV